MDLVEPISHLFIEVMNLCFLPSNLRGLQDAHVTVGFICLSLVFLLKVAQPHKRGCKIIIMSGLFGVGNDNLFLVQKCNWLSNHWFCS